MTDSESDSFNRLGWKQPQGSSPEALRLVTSLLAARFIKPSPQIDW